jgi:hypothetical protein
LWTNPTPTSIYIPACWNCISSKIEWFCASTYSSTDSASRKLSSCFTSCWPRGPWIVSAGFSCHKVCQLMKILSYNLGCVNTVPPYICCWYYPYKRYLLSLLFLLLM